MLLLRSNVTRQATSYGAAAMRCVAIPGRDVTNARRGVKLAVLHQAIEPPVIGGVRKAMKPGGYKDSSADIAYVVHHNAKKNTIPPTVPEVQVVTPTSNPNPTTDSDWSFPDTEEGMVSAIKDHNVTHIWANTILFASHPLQISKALDQIVDNVYLIGQPPSLVEKYDDKNWVNDRLRQDPKFKLPQCWVVNLNNIPSSSTDHLREHLSALRLPYPVIGKPVRGRGSHGVKLCHDEESLTTHLSEILSESPQIMIEEFLAGQEATVTVMPPSSIRPRHWSLPVVERFNHADGVAPYNGVVAVIANSRIVPLDTQAYSVAADGGIDLEADNAADPDNAYVDIRRQCEAVAAKMGCTAPMRVDVRRRRDELGSTRENPFLMFDINMKPNMTGPGRPGRNSQASLTAMAAEALGWDYAALLREMLRSARPLREALWETTRAFAVDCAVSTSIATIDLW